MKNFKVLKIWQVGINISVLTYRFAHTLNKEDRYYFAPQIVRAAISIPSNIAEGASRRSQKDNGRFIEIALGSSFELETQLIIAKANKMGNLDLIQEVLKLIVQEQKMIQGFAAKLISS
jgi:four helix bundle protein